MYKMKTKKVLFILGIFTLLGLFGTILHTTYMEATSYDCSQDLPKEYIVTPNGEVNQKIETKCEGGILADFPLKT